MDTALAVSFYETQAAAKSAAKMDKPAEVSEEQNMSQVLSGKKILVVDDEPDLREILRDELLSAGVEVVEAENGKQGWELVQKNNFDAIISDIRMPGGDGISLAKLVKAKVGPTPVIYLITGFADVSPAEAYEIGVEGFIYKPFNLGPVMSHLQKAIAKNKNRWLEPYKNNNVKNLPVVGSFADLLATQDISVGRGGIYLSGVFTDIRVNDVIKITLSDKQDIFGIVRWTQHTDDGQFKPGLGIEFLQLSAELHKFILHYLDKNQPLAFIPRK